VYCLSPRPQRLLTTHLPLAVSPPPRTHRERETGAVSDNRKLSLGFFINSYSLSYPVETLTSSSTV
jgi:hypothetical protein